MHGHYTQPYYIGKFKKNQNRMRRKTSTIICICMKSANFWFSSDQPPSLRSSPTSSWNARLHFFFSLLLWNIMIFPFVKNPKSYGWNLWNFIFDRSNLIILNTNSLSSDCFWWLHSARIKSISFSICICWLSK